MKMTASEVKSRLGEALDIAMRDEDVLIERHGRVVAFIGSAEEHELFQQFKLERLRKRLALREAEAERGEFTDDSLEHLQAEALEEFQARKR